MLVMCSNNNDCGWGSCVEVWSSIHIIIIIMYKVHHYVYTGMCASMDVNLN